MEYEAEAFNPEESTNENDVDQVPEVAAFPESAQAMLSGTTWGKRDSRPSNHLQIAGNKETMNLNSLILDNIRSSPYFKNTLTGLKTLPEMIDEIYYNVGHLEPWERGSRKMIGAGGSRAMEVRGVSMGGIVSSAYCCLYKLFTLKINRKQLYQLINHTDSPYIRGVGFMYVRYALPASQFWDFYEEYLEDDEEVDPKAGGGEPMTIGQMLKLFLTKLDWYATLFPRIPVPVQKSIEANLRERNCPPPSLLDGVGVGDGQNYNSAASGGGGGRRTYRKLPSQFDDYKTGMAALAAQANAASSRNNQEQRPDVRNDVATAVDDGSFRGDASTRNQSDAADRRRDDRDGGRREPDGRSPHSNRDRDRRPPVDDRAPGSRRGLGRDGTMQRSRDRRDNLSDRGRDRTGDRDRRRHDERRRRGDKDAGSDRKRPDDNHRRADSHSQRDKSSGRTADGSSGRRQRTSSPDHKRRRDDESKKEKDDIDQKSEAGEEKPRQLKFPIYMRKDTVSPAAANTETADEAKPKLKFPIYMRQQQEEQSKEDSEGGANDSEKKKKLKFPIYMRTNKNEANGSVSPNKPGSDKSGSTNQPGSTKQDRSHSAGSSDSSASSSSSGSESEPEQNHSATHTRDPSKQSTETSSVGAPVSRETLDAESNMPGDVAAKDGDLIQDEKTPESKDSQNAASNQLKQKRHDVPHNVSMKNGLHNDHSCQEDEVSNDRKRHISDNEREGSSSGAKQSRTDETSALSLVDQGETKVPSDLINQHAIPVPGFTEHDHDANQHSTIGPQSSTDTKTHEKDRHKKKASSGKHKKKQSHHKDKSRNKDTTSSASSEKKKAKKKHRKHHHSSSSSKKKKSKSHETKSGHSAEAKVEKIAPAAAASAE